MMHLLPRTLEISRWALYFHSCMPLMMTNVALSLQWCVPRILAGGLEGGFGVGGGIRDGEKKTRRRIRK